MKALSCTKFPNVLQHRKAMMLLKKASLSSSARLGVVVQIHLSAAIHFSLGLDDRQKWIQRIHQPPNFSDRRVPKAWFSFPIISSHVFHPSKSKSIHLDGMLQRSRSQSCECYNIAPSQVTARWVGVPMGRVMGDSDQDPGFEESG